MQWTDEAEELIGRVPFFVRPFARRRVEQMVADEGGDVVTAAACRRARARFADEKALAGEEAPSGDAERREAPDMWRLEACSGPERDCPFTVRDHTDLPARVRALFEQLGLRQWTPEHFQGLVLPHHKLKVGICACPNGCTQPQIKDIAVVAHSVPARGAAECTTCGRCAEACPDNLVRLEDGHPVIDREGCVDCGVCVRACPTGALVEGWGGYAVLVGGRLGRHPHLARELLRVEDADAALLRIRRLVRHYMDTSQPNERFTRFIERVGVGAVREATG